MATESNYFCIFVSWSGNFDCSINVQMVIVFIYLEGSRILVIRLSYNVLTVEEGTQNNISGFSGAAYKSWHYLMPYLAAISLNQYPASGV